MEDIETSQVSLTLRKKCLSPTDSPHSMNYNVTDFIGKNYVLSLIYYKMLNYVKCVINSAMNLLLNAFGHYVLKLANYFHFSIVKQY